MLILHVGCGDVYFEGWTNINLTSPKADLHHDLRSHYSEHFIEHLYVEDGFQISRKKLFDSDYRQLKNRETRTDSKLIVEAMK